LGAVPLWTRALHTPMRTVPALRLPVVHEDFEKYREIQGRFLMALG
jgi:hypothetical protein